MSSVVCSFTFVLVKLLSLLFCLLCIFVCILHHHGDLMQILHIFSECVHPGTHFLIFVFQIFYFLLPCGDGQSAVPEILFQFPAGGVILFQFVFVFVFEFFFSSFESDAVPFIVNRLGVSVILSLPQKLCDLFQPGFKSGASFCAFIKFHPLRRCSGFKIGNGK